MKKFVNDPAKFVPEMLEGIFLANEGKLKYEPKYNIIYRADRPSKDHVSVIQGSGSGHDLEVEVSKLVFEMLGVGQDRRWEVGIQPSAVQLLPG